MTEWEGEAATSIPAVRVMGEGEESQAPQVAYIKRPQTPDSDIKIAKPVAHDVDDW